MRWTVAVLGVFLCNIATVHKYMFLSSAFVIVMDYSGRVASIFISSI